MLKIIDPKKPANPSEPRFTSLALVLNNEQRHLYEALLKGYIETFQPSGPVETDLVEQMAAAKWREQRSWTLECATLDYAAEAMRPELAKRIKSMDEAVRSALAFTDRADNSSGLELLQRYESRHTRTWRLALRQLRELQSAPPPRRRKSKLRNEPGEIVELKQAA